MFFFHLSANDCIAFDVSGYLLQVADGTKHLPHLWDLCSNEIVVRSAKHILKVMRIIFPASTSFGLEKMGWNAYIISLNAIKFHCDDFAKRCDWLMILQRGVIVTVDTVTPHLVPAVGVKVSNYQVARTCFKRQSGLPCFYECENVFLIHIKLFILFCLKKIGGCFVCYACVR
jgi:hypothetical protein